MRTAAIGMLLLAGVLCGCSTQKGGVTKADLTITQEAMGKPISDKPSTLFGGDLMVRAYENGVVFAKKDGTLLRYTINRGAPLQEVEGIAADQLKKLGVGSQIHAEQRFSDGDTLYCFTLYERGINVYRWGSHCESVLCDRPFVR